MIKLINEEKREAPIKEIPALIVNNIILCKEYIGDFQTDDSVRVHRGFTVPDKSRGFAMC